MRGVQGDIIAYEDEQLALAYYYGDGREQSCENTVLTVSAPAGRPNHRRYAAVNMDAVGIITDMVGGVTLTVHLPTFPPSTPPWWKGRPSPSTVTRR